jgi:SCAMP family
MINNYPTFYPILYHDINLDIPPQSQFLCKSAYRSWQFFICIGVFVDLICSIVIVSIANGRFLTFFLYKLFYAFLIPATTFFCLYLTLYKALKLNHQFYWICHGITAFTWIGYLCVSMVGSVFTYADSGNAFPGGESGFYGIFYFFGIGAYALGITGLVARVWWLITLFFYIIQTRTIYQTFSTNRSTQTKINSTTNQTELGQIDKSRQVGGVVNVNGREVHVAVDTKTATSVASKAYSSGAAG